MSSERVRRWRKWGLIVAALLLFAEICAPLVLALIWRADLRGPPAAHYTAVAVLHADAPPALQGTRRALDRAVELYRHGLVRWILCIGGNRPAAGLHSGDEMRAYLIAQNVLAEHISTETASYDTRTNAKALSTMLEVAPAGPTAVIAYPAHQPRVRYHLRKQAPRIDAVLIAPRAEGSLARVAYDSWVALHHEIAAWILTLALSEQAYDEMLNRLRLGSPLSGVRSFQRIQANIVDAQLPGPID